MSKAEIEPYGAEALEKQYPGTALVSLTVAAMLVLGVLIYPMLKMFFAPVSDEPITVQATRVINYSELAAPPPIDLEKRIVEPLEAVPTAKTVKYLPPVVKKDEEVPDEEYMPTREEIGRSVIGTRDIEGSDSIYVEQHKVEIVSEPIKPPPTETLTFVERMPEFPGGQKALQDYLKGALRYPTAAREAEIQGTVYMGFVVETDGSISDVEVMRSVHPLLDAEAVRVISAMPHWIPGEQNQKKVRVRFALPINFRMHTP